MSKRTLLDLAPESRRQTIYHEEDGRTFIETRQDVSHLIDAARILADVAPARSDGWRFLCVIPDTVYNQAVTEGWLHDRDRWRRWMNDRDNRAFNGGRERVS